MGLQIYPGGMERKRGPSVEISRIEIITGKDSQFRTIALANVYIEAVMKRFYLTKEKYSLRAFSRRKIYWENHEVTESRIG